MLHNKDEPKQDIINNIVNINLSIVQTFKFGGYNYVQICLALSDGWWQVEKLDRMNIIL